MFCTKCGTKLPDDSKFCTKCGAKLAAEEDMTGAAPQQSDVPQKKKSKKLPVILGVTASLVLILVILAVIGSSGDVSDSGGGGSSGVNLSQSYVNEAEGISFRYPSAWVPFGEEEIDNLEKNISKSGSGSGKVLAFLGNENEDLPEANTYIQITKFDVPQDAIDHLFISDEEFAETFDDDVSIKNTSVTEVSGLPARTITYINSQGTGYQSYFYSVGSTLYRIDFSWLGENPGDAQRFFDAILGSYTVTVPDTLDKASTANTSESFSGDTAQGQNIDSSAPSATASKQIDAEQAQSMVDNWFSDHELTYCVPIPSQINAEGCYNFDLWVDGISYGTVYVDKNSGVLKIQDYSRSFDLQTLDEWYDNIWLPYINGEADYSLVPDDYWEGESGGNPETSSGDAYKSAVHVSWANLMRYPEQYSGMTISAYGKVSQILNDGGAIIVNADGDSSQQYWIDVSNPMLWDGIQDYARVIVGDMVLIYGTFEGLQTVEYAINNVEHQVPYITATEGYLEDAVE